MKTTLRQGVAIAMAACATIPVSALATNGYFSHGWGTESKAMAGVAAALPLDTMVTATNPAGMAFISNSFDVGVSAFKPSPRGYEANADYATNEMGFPTGPFVTPGEYDSDTDWFLIPSFGYNHQLNSDSTIGLAIYGNGGMNTHYQDRPPFENFAAYPNQLAWTPGAQPPAGVYPQNVFASPSGLLFQMTPQGVAPYTGPSNAPNNANPNGVFTATTPTGINLEQLFIEVPYTLKVGNGRQSIGIAPVFAIQTFEARGLQPFQQLSVDPSNVSNQGKSWSYGAGVHFGWYGQINDQLALGASYRTQVYMSKFDEYAGLFADEGSFDIPPMFNIGLAYKPQPNLTLAADYQHIFYNSVDAISNSSDLDITGCQTPGQKPSYCLGGKSGLGFGWQDQDILKIGLKYDVNEQLSLMGGVSYNSDVFATNAQGLFNVLAPATVRWHITGGVTYRPLTTDAFSLAVAYMPKETWDGVSPQLVQTQTGSLYMEQLEITLSWNHRF